MRTALVALALGLLASSANASGPHVFRLENGTIPTSKPPAAPTDKLKYYGGRVLSNVNVVEVSWGSSVDAAYMTKLEGYYKAIVKSPFVDWLTEYDTFGLYGYVDGKLGSGQHIGRGTFGGAFVITPANTKTTLFDDEIQTELKQQLKDGKLPAPVVDAHGNVDSLYMFDFPAGITIKLLGITSCSSFGAYHFTTVYNGMNVPYGIHPNCGYNFDISTMIHSHELAEAMTDMEVGLVDQSAATVRPIAWVTLATTAWGSLESADLCQGYYETISGYLVQKVWSNYANGCVAQIPLCDGVMTPPSCRDCNVFDSGNACEGAKPACATEGTQKGRCVSCTSKHSEACIGATPVCDDSTYTCVTCIQDGDCAAATPVCEGKALCRPCAKDSECHDGQVCDTSQDDKKGQCVECYSDAQCAQGFQCTNHKCTQKPLPDAGVGPDAGLPGDAESPIGNDAGCGCHTTTGQASGMLGFIAVALSIVRRRTRVRLRAS